MQNKFKQVTNTKILGAVILWSSIILFVNPSQTLAETHIEDGYIGEDMVWTASSSPYILGTDIDIARGKTLTIENGVEVRADPSLEYAPSILVAGTLDVRGTRANRVNITGLYNISSYEGYLNIDQATVNMAGGIGLTYATGTISTSTITGISEGAGVYVKASALNINGSRIVGNDVGVFVDPVRPVFMVKADDGVGGEGNALVGISGHLAQSVVAVVPSHVVIENSSLVGNAKLNIKNSEETSTVNAIHNWWGSIDGPASSTIIGNVNVSPWLDHDPTLEATSTECCSSVLFIPGLMGSWLYKDVAGTFGTSTNTLWAPNRNDDVRKLFLDTYGSSTDVTIYTGEPIDDVFNIYSVYGSFMKFLDGLVGNKQINEWRSYGYDWRKPIDEVVAGGERKSANATSRETLIDIVNDMALRSPTGKVSIVAHSNGGLVAKALVKKLSEIGKGGLIDNVVTVATPFLGTPSAVSGLLHGDHQSLAGGLLMKSSVARQLGENMSSAYSLLPSRKYFEKVAEPIIRFYSTSTLVNDGSYQNVIDTFSGMFSFINDLFHVRLTPPVTDTSKPIIGNSLLANAGDSVQSSMANFEWPVTLKKWSILGWNKDTPKGLIYSDGEVCQPLLWFKINCKIGLSRDESITSMGDGTVVAPSAAEQGILVNNSRLNVDSKVVSIDLASTSIIEDKNISHANILESSTTQSVIGNILTANSLASLAQLGAVSLGEPNYSREPIKLVISLEGNAELHITDEEGNKTGVDTLSGTSSSSNSSNGAVIPNDTVISYMENIPGSSLLIRENGDLGTYSRVSLPNTFIGMNGSNVPRGYDVTINGGGFGSVALNIEMVQGDNIIEKIVYPDIPISPLSVATTSIVEGHSSSTTSLISSSTLVVDIDGDIVVDANVQPINVGISSNIGNNAISSNNATSSFQSSLTKVKILKVFIQNVIGNDLFATKLLKRLDNIEEKLKQSVLKNGMKDSIKSKKIDVSEDIIKKIFKKLSHKKLKNVSAADKTAYLEIMQAMLDILESK